MTKRIPTRTGLTGAGAILLFAATVLPAQGAVTRGPYLQRGSSTSMLLKWSTDSSSDSVVRYGPSPTQLTSTATSSTGTTGHLVTVTGLQPQTRYYYSVGSSSGAQAGGTSAYFFETSPPVGAPRPTRIWVLGDAGTKNSNQRAVRDAYKTYVGTATANLTLMLGDNAYSDGTDSDYQAAVFDMYPDMLRQTVLWPTLGNHDAQSADSSAQSGPYYSIFSLPKQGESGGLASGTEAYYSFDYGNIHFICLDSSDSSRSTSSPMLTWLKNDLLSTTQDWIIAFWHHPPYSKGSHDSDSDGTMTDMRQNALPILEAGGVDLVLTGHSHSYERSFLLDGHYGDSGTLTTAMVLDSGDGKVTGDGAYQKSAPPSLPHDGAVYVVAGSSGQTGGGSLDHPAMYRSLNVLGSLVIDVNGPQMDVRFVRSNAALGDEFTITKGEVAAPHCKASDLSGDGAVDGLDLAEMASRFGASVERGTMGDLDDDGRVDGDDLALLAPDFGSHPGHCH